MSKKLKFLLWPVAGAPILAESGASSSFSDGFTVELFSDAKNYVDSNNLQFSDVTFALSMFQNQTPLAQHKFQMKQMVGANIWLVANPTMTDPNGSFTAAFINALCNLGAGEHLVTVQLDASHGGVTTTINDGEILFKNDGVNASYQALIPLFEDADGARNAANEVVQKNYEDQREKEAAAKHSANYFKVTIDNTNSYKTLYVIQKDHRTLSENIKELLANKSLTLDLSRNMTYDLLFYRQDENKDQAYHFATVNESSEGKKYSVS